MLFTLSGDPKFSAFDRVVIVLARQQCLSLRALQKRLASSVDTARDSQFKISRLPPSCSSPQRTVPRPSGISAASSALLLVHDPQRARGAREQSESFQRKARATADGSRFFDGFGWLAL
jgi:hypothetical protein